MTDGEATRAAELAACPDSARVAPVETWAVNPNARLTAREDCFYDCDPRPVALIACDYCDGAHADPRDCPYRPR